MELKDERNALERAMLHFSHLNKETERIGEDLYKITLFYEREDETELLIRVLSFGPVLKVVFPDDFTEKLVQRLKKQKEMRIQKKKSGSATFFPRLFLYWMIRYRHKGTNSNCTVAKFGIAADLEIRVSWVRIPPKTVP